MNIDDPVNDIMNVYGEKCKGIHVPNPEQEFRQKCKQESNDVLKYFSRGNQTPVVEATGTIPPNAPNQQVVVNEAQVRNNLLSEAAISMAKVLPMFEGGRDRDYVKEIREAIEELID